MQKFYFHDAATGNTGTLPTGENSASTASVTATGANTQRSMNDTIGVSQTSIALTTLASTSAQPCLFRMFESLPLAAQTISAGNWQLSLAGSESNANSNLHFTVVRVRVAARDRRGRRQPDLRPGRRIHRRAGHVRSRAI